MGNSQRERSLARPGASSQQQRTPTEPTALDQIQHQPTSLNSSHPVSADPRLSRARLRVVCVTDFAGGALSDEAVPVLLSEAIVVESESLDVRVRCYTRLALSCWLLHLGAWSVVGG